MDNTRVARVLEAIADLLELEDVQWKPRAYRAAAQSIAFMSEDINDVYQKGLLEDIPHVGSSIAKKIAELIKTGSLRYYERLKKKSKVNIEELSRIEGLGPKTIKHLYDALHITNLASLKKAAEEGKIRNLEGMGKKREKNLLEAIHFAQKTKDRHVRGHVVRDIDALKTHITRNPAAGLFLIAGSYRRYTETIGDIDILVTSTQPKKLITHINAFERIERMLAKGSTKTSFVLKNGLHVDVRVVDKNSFGSAAQYFTGSKYHNIALRKIAQKKGLKLSEYGLFRGEKRIAGKNEKSVYAGLGLQYISPELRENQGEIELAKNKKIPTLVAKVHGDVQMHTHYSDGANSVGEMIHACKKMGYAYMGISDHAGTLKIAGAMNKQQIAKQRKEIDKQDFHVLQGAEVDIDSKGKLTLKNDALKDFDYVIASIHSGFHQTKQQLTTRILAAMQNEYVRIIAHPTGRVIGKREGYTLDWERVFNTSKETNTYLEINASPERLDLRDEHIHAAINAGCKLIINTDAHNTDSLHCMDAGIGMARRGYAQDKHIINTKSYMPFLKLLKA
ncbi:DNA polymerase III [archaeon CG10_big_fil_rev_8_21_14_0_10_43_11]|nr:MAG: DNA polymerase III [archaeon CG10_big_fil_rev_8_21_14_0_10_43_11]